MVPQYGKVCDICIFDEIYQLEVFFLSILHLKYIPYHFTIWNTNHIRLCKKIIGHCKLELSSPGGATYNLFLKHRKLH